MNLLHRYSRWLHTRWPAGHVEKLPVTDEEGRTNVAGVFVVGDLRGVPLLKLSSENGARAVRAFAAESSFERDRAAKGEGVLDVAIVGGGVSGMAAALEARERGLDFAVFEASQPFSTIVNFPKGKPIYTYPKELEPDSPLKVTAEVKEALVDELRAQTLEAGVHFVEARVERVEKAGGKFRVHLAGGESRRALRVVLALGRSGNFRRLDVPGEDLDKVYNRLHDPKDFCGSHALVVGGGDSALETAIALAICGADVTLSYRKKEFSRPKPENLDKLERLAADPLAEDVSIEEPSSERVSTSVGAFLGPARETGRVTVRMETEVREIRGSEVVIATADGGTEILPNDVVFPMIGREAPLDFFRRSGVTISGDVSAKFVATLAAFVTFLIFVYHWKAGGSLTHWFAERGLFPFGIELPAASGAGSLLGTVTISAGTPAFWYTLAYSVAIVGFGIRRIRRRRTPYVRAQTWTLAAIQVLPLFLLPSIILPWVGHRGAFGERHAVARLAPETVTGWRELVADVPEGLRAEADAADAVAAAARARGLLPEPVRGWPELAVESSWGERVIVRSAAEGAPTREAIVRLKDGRVHVRDDSKRSSWWADQLFPASEWDPQGREYWRASGFILAWPLFLWNVFTDQPLFVWLAIGFLQTFVAIPALIYFWGKGAYCGWICSCGGLAETMGDAHRHKMPHGPRWNRLNLAGQVILLVAGVLLVLRVAGWMLPDDHAVNAAYLALLQGKTVQWTSLPFPFGFLNYKWFVDLFLVGILGTGLYFHFSGRVWCRFACPLAALMHIYARFSRFRILADKKKCISCNVCTSVCHQGIDIMNFANKGLPMEDPECVRCSACVQMCPTGVLSFGQVDGQGRVVATDSLEASPVRMREHGA